MDVLQQGLADLYESGELSDFTIRAGRTFSRCTRRSSARSRSTFARCEGKSDSANLKVIGSDDNSDDAECGDPDAIKLMVDFLYHLDYIAEPLTPSTVQEEVATNPSPGTLPEEFSHSVSLEDDWVGLAKKKRKKKSSFVWGFDKGLLPIQDSADPSENVVMYAKVFAAAIKYKVPALQKLAASKFASAAKGSWDHPSFVEAARIAFTTTPEDVREPRDVVGKTIHDHNRLLDKVSIERVVKANPDLHFELLRLARGLPAVTEKKVIDEGLKCAECSSWLFYDDCYRCANEYRGCCGSCQNPVCPG